MNGTRISNWWDRDVSKHISLVSRSRCSCFCDWTKRISNGKCHSSIIRFIKITPIIVDYCNIPLLQTKLRATIEQNGPIDLVIAWIHSYAGRTLESIVSEVSPCRNRPWKLFHILGSSANLSGIQENLNLPNSALYYQIQLGFIIENGHSRWLTNEEISQGVIDAIRQNRLITIVGTLQPWEKRPS